MASFAGDSGTNTRLGASSRGSGVVAFHDGAARVTHYILKSKCLTMELEAWKSCSDLEIRSMPVFG